jgi:hypothetical protein
MYKGILGLTLNFRQHDTSVKMRVGTTILLSVVGVLLVVDSLWFGFTHAKATAYLLTLMFSILWDAAVYATIELILAGGAFLLGGAALVWSDPPESVLDGLGKVWWTLVCAALGLLCASALVGWTILPFAPSLSHQIFQSVSHEILHDLPL